MTALLKNRAFVALTGADVLETIGVSLFNLILLTYARTFAQAQLLVSVVSVAAVLPGVFGLALGRLADRLVAKGRWLMRTKWLQAGLYAVMTPLINHRTMGIFFMVVAINLGSDLLGQLSACLRQPLLQAKVPTQWQAEALGINQGIATLMQLVGQAGGVVLIGLNGSYQLASAVNAFTFLLAGLVLNWQQRVLTLPLVAKKLPVLSIRALLRQVKVVMEASAGLNFVAVSLNLLLVNAVGASIDSILTLFLLQQGSRLPVSFSVGIVIVNTGFIGGLILGSWLQLAWLSRLTYRTMVWFTIGVLSLIYIELWWGQNFWVVTLGMLLAGFGMGQLNPKLNAGLLQRAPAEIVGSLQGLLMSLATLAVPIGSIGIVLIYNVESQQAAYGVSLGLLVLAAGCLIKRSA
ncbi:MFS transporter [Lactiplantibacillus mudanjiangensis]|uniref:Integral membrane protein [Lactobacillus plantarum JDM1] n=1 Tax=Lactiplantibacillus mudanjiangensis TaxID=1296538 RepID=A0A660E414_9LACO|nr:MFS transporter [Lactiplantibacillus mudanjiangensis]VDG24164.1 integral membrane protein [Lactobacillus plantarum JDM1] [Lactiplantibacillus mudanjiangensis]VDG30148.1 integral membrane protein [Lactobacillus plantarum JDM1] [Lactiplantibacillus mudanjiangensis]